MVRFQKSAAGAGLGLLLMETPAPATRKTAANLPVETESWGVNSVSLQGAGAISVSALVAWEQ